MAEERSSRLNAAQSPLQPKTWIGIGQPLRWISLASVEKVRDGDASGASMTQRRVNAPGRDRRNHAGGVAD